MGCHLHPLGPATILGCYLHPLGPATSLGCHLHPLQWLTLLAPPPPPLHPPPLLQLVKRRAVHDRSSLAAWSRVQQRLHHHAAAVQRQQQQHMAEARAEELRQARLAAQALGVPWSLPGAAALVEGSGLDRAAGLHTDTAAVAGEARMQAWTGPGQWQQDDGHVEARAVGMAVQARAEEVGGCNSLFLSCA